MRFKPIVLLGALMLALMAIIPAPDLAAFDGGTKWQTFYDVQRLDATATDATIENDNGVIPDMTTQGLTLAGISCSSAELREAAKNVTLTLHPPGTAFSYENGEYEQNYSGQYEYGFDSDASTIDDGGGGIATANVSDTYFDSERCASGTLPTAAAAVPHEGAMFTTMHSGEVPSVMDGASTRAHTTPHDQLDRNARKSYSGDGYSLAYHAS